MAFDPADLRRFLDPERWAALERVKRDAWIARWREGPAAQLRAMAELRSFSHEVRGAPTARERDEDLATHVRVAAWMRRADRHD